jgi:signal transduction histidine kinase
MPQEPNPRNVAGVSVPALLRRQTVQDALISVVYTVSVVAITVRLDHRGEPGRPLDVLAYVCMIGVGVALAFRRRWPTGTLYAILALTLVYVIRDYTGGPFFLAVFIAIATVASVMPTREALPRVAVAFVALALSGFFVDSADGSGWVHLLYLSWSVVAFLAGKTVRDRRELLTGLRERNRHLEETQEEEARRRVAEERVRIARDLHDIVAHNIAAISLQAATGAYVADAHPDKARDALLAIRQASRQTLDDLRCTLDVLRDGDDSAPLAPTPGLSALPVLVDSVVEAGVPVTLVLEGDTGAVPEAVAGAAYRIVQESLTNVMRHAGPARVTVAVTRLADGLDVSVEDDGRGASAAPGPTGHGLAGMRERAHTFGGTFAAGPRPGGGFAVRAWLPVVLEPEEPRAGSASGRTDQASIPHPAAAGGVSP